MASLISSSADVCPVSRPKKFFGIRLPRILSKKSRAKLTPVFEEAASIGDSNNNQPKAPERLEADEMTVFKPSNTVPVSSNPLETGLTVTPAQLREMLESTSETKELGATEHLVVQGTKLAAVEVLGSKLARKLAISFPHLKSLSLWNLNLSSQKEESKLRLRDFPAGLESVSLRDSAFDPESFFNGIRGEALKKLRVLDLSRTTFVRGRFLTSVTAWPQIGSLRELYLEGALQGRSAASLGNLLRSFPKLQILDLECADLTQGDLRTIARLLPDLRELYLGQTGLRDAAVLQMASSEDGLSKVEVLCLCETGVTGVGLRTLVQVCPRLRSVVGKRSPLRLREIESISGVEIKLMEKTDILSFLRGRCCDHYSSRRNRDADDAGAVEVTRC